MTHLVYIHHVVQSTIADIQVRRVGQEVVPHKDAHEDEIVDDALELELEGQLQGAQTQMGKAVNTAADARQVARYLDC